MECSFTVICDATFWLEFETKSRTEIFWVSVWGPSLRFDYWVEILRLGLILELSDSQLQDWSWSMDLVETDSKNESLPSLWLPSRPKIRGISIGIVISLIFILVSVLEAVWIPGILWLTRIVNSLILITIPILEFVSVMSQVEN